MVFSFPVLLLCTVVFIQFQASQDPELNYLIFSDDHVISFSNKCNYFLGVAFPFNCKVFSSSLSLLLRGCAMDAGGLLCRWRQLHGTARALLDVTLCQRLRSTRPVPPHRLGPPWRLPATSLSSAARWGFCPSHLLLLCLLPFPVAFSLSVSHLWR